MKYIILIIAGLLCNAELSSQSKLDVITLKSGVIYKGTISEHVPQGKTTMVLIDGRTVEMNSNEIEALDEAKNRGFISSDNGYFHSSSIGFLLGNSGYGNEANFQYNMINGYKWKRLYAGGGTGIEMLNETMLIPLFADASYVFKEGKTSPYIGAQIGRLYNPGYESNNANFYYYNGNYKSGNMVGLNLGIKHSFTSELGLLLSAGYRYYDLNGEYRNQFWSGTEWMFNDVSTNTYLHRFNLKIGLLFN